MQSRKPFPFRPSRRGWVVIAVGALLVSSYFADSVASVGRVRSGVTVGSLALGGRNETEARILLSERAQLLVAQPVELFADTRHFSVSPADIRFVPKPETTLADAMDVGRRGNVVVRFWQRFRTLFASTDVGWESSYDVTAVRTLVRSWAHDIDTPGHEAGIEARGDTIVPVGGVPSRKLDQTTAVTTVVEGLETWPRRAVSLPIAVVSRRTDIDDARKAAEEANRWAGAPIRVVGPDGTGITLSRVEIASMLDAVARRQRGSWRLEVRFDPDRVTDLLGERMQVFEREARSASFRVSGSSVSIVRGQEGRRFDARATALELADAARREGRRIARVRFRSAEPELTTDEARSLHITELVSTFTTNHPCCAARVRNIHRIADTVDGAIVRPGETFSLNAYVGERTEEKGYVLAPMIFDGEFKDSVGGGVSQFATTTFNAVFFGGYKFVEYKPHSYYISRYPPGREATVSWPTPDLKFTNDSGAGVLIKTGYTDTSITVSFYGDKEGKVVTAETGPRLNPTDFDEKYVENPEVPVGQEHVAQEGAEGFDITVYRVIRQHGRVRRERFDTHYKPEPRVIEVAPGHAPCPSPEPGATPCPPKPSGTPAPTGSPPVTLPGDPVPSAAPTPTAEH